MLRGLRRFLSKDSSDHHSTYRLKERGVEKGSGQCPTTGGCEVFHHTNTGTVLRATLQTVLRERAERVWAFPSAITQCHLELKLK